MRRVTLLFVVAVAGVWTSLGSALALAPRVRLVEIVTIFAGAFAAGAALVSAVVVLRNTRR